MQRIAEGSRGAVSKMRDVIWAIDSSRDCVQDLIDRIRSYTRVVFDPLDIRHRVVVNQIDPQQTLTVAVRQNLYLIFKEAVHNAMKHSGASLVVVTLSKDRRKIRLQVEDNGIGMSERTESDGQGIRNMYKKAERIGGVLTIRPGTDAGTIVAFDVEL